MSISIFHSEYATYYYITDSNGEVVATFSTREEAENYISEQ